MTYLYLPVVTVAAAFGRREAFIVGGTTIVAYFIARIMDETSIPTLVQRGAALLITMILLATITRRTVGALEAAIGRAREARRRERRRARQMAGVEAVGHLLARGSSTAALEELMDLMTRRFGYQNVSIYLLQDDGTVKLGAQRGYETVLESFDGTTGVVGRVMRTRETAFVRDVRDDPDYRVAKGDVLSEISAPLMAAGELLGVLNVEDSRVDGLDDSDRSTMILIAERLAAAIALGPGARGHRPARGALPGPGRLLANRQRLARPARAVHGHRGRPRGGHEQRHRRADHARHRPRRLPHRVDAGRRPALRRRADPRG